VQLFCGFRRKSVLYLHSHRLNAYLSACLTVARYLHAKLTASKLSWRNCYKNNAIDDFTGFTFLQTNLAVLLTCEIGAKLVKQEGVFLCSPSLCRSVLCPSNLLFTLQPKFLLMQVVTTTCKHTASVSDTSAHSVIKQHSQVTAILVFRDINLTVIFTNNQTCYKDILLDSNSLLLLSFPQS
jgi:hypothetical protein